MSEQPTPDLEKIRQMAEMEAAEALQTEETFSSEAQELLVSKVTDPNLSMYILGFYNAHATNLTRQQVEKLFDQALSDPEVVEIFYITLTESGVELNENEKWWFQRIQEVRGEEV